MADARMRGEDTGVAVSRRLRVLPRPRGSWVVATEHGDVLSEHATATEAELAALARMRDGDELIVVDRYHRSRQRTRPQSAASTRGPRNAAG